MSEILQTFKFYDYSNVTIEYVIKSKLVDLDSISRLLGLEPTRGWSKGDKFQSKQMNEQSREIELIERERIETLWVYRTDVFVDSDRFDDHAKFLINKLEDRQNPVKKILDDIDAFKTMIFIYLKVDEDEDQVGLGAPSELVRHLTEICSYIELRTEKMNNSA